MQDAYTDVAARRAGADTDFGRKFAADEAVEVTLAAFNGQTSQAMGETVARLEVLLVNVRGAQPQKSGEQTERIRSDSLMDQAVQARDTAQLILAKVTELARYI